MTRLTMLLAGAMLSAACGASPVPTAPAEVSPPTSEDFSGTLTVNGAATHPFATTRAGTVTATLVTLTLPVEGEPEPEEPVTIGLTLGTWNGSACNMTPGLANDQASPGSILLVNASAAGALCVRVYDVGDLIEPLLYLVRVSHP